MIKHIYYRGAQIKQAYLNGKAIISLAPSAYSPLQEFADGRQGVWYDPSDLSTLYQDAAGTIPVTASGDPVGLMLDKSGNGNHAKQTISSSRPIYKTDGILHWLGNDGVDDYFVIPEITYLTNSLLAVFQGFSRINNSAWHSVKSNTPSENIWYIGLSNGASSANGSANNVFGDARVNGVPVINERLNLANRMVNPSVFSSVNNSVTRFNGMKTTLMRYREVSPAQNNLYGHIEIVGVENDVRVKIEKYLATKMRITI